MIARTLLGLSRWCAVAGLAAALAACSSSSNDDEKKETIAPLVKLEQEEVRLTDVWSRRVGSQGEPEQVLTLAPAIDGEVLYAANAKGGVLAVDKATGDVRWKHSLDVPVISATGAGAGLVVVSDEKGMVHALDAATGEPRWQAQASSEVLAAAAIEGDVVVVQAIDSHVQAFDVATGKPRWSYNGGQAVLSLRGTSTPVIREGQVYVAFDTGKIAVLDAATGILRWEQRVTVAQGRSELERVIDMQGDILVTASDIYTGSYQGSVVALERERGRPLWDEKASVAHTLAMENGNVYVVESSNVLRALRMGSGREEWRSELFEGRQLSGAAVIGDYVATADFEGYIHLLSQKDGHYAGRYKVGGDGVRNNLFSDGQTLYALTNSGKLYALQIKQP